jgi:hypothetical protein
VDANGQSFAYVYSHGDEHDAQVAKSLILDEARRIASNIAKLPALAGVEACPARNLGQSASFTP